MLVGAREARYRRELIAAIKARGLEGVFQIIDDCRDIPAAYMLADVVVSASTRPEGFGRVMAEAQAMGRPVIATDHGGAREIIRAGETGWLVPPEDAPAMAAAIADALALAPAARAELAATAVENVRAQFGTRQMTDRTIAVYEEILFPESAAAESSGPVAA